MDLKDLRQGIDDLLTRATLSRPEPDDDVGNAEWSYRVGVYLYQFVIRARGKGITLEVAHKTAVRAAERILKDREADRILSLELPDPPGTTEAAELGMGGPSSLKAAETPPPDS